MTIDRVVVSVTLRIGKNNYCEMPPRSCGVERLLDDESLARKYLTLGLKFLAGQINWTKNKPFWDQKQIRGGRMIILRQWEYKVSMP